MGAFKSVFRVIAALFPIVYCGGLIYYFLHVTGSVKEAESEGLGPTLVGLSVVGLLFCIPLIVTILRLFVGPRSSGPRSRGPGGRGGPDAPADDDDGGIDADAVVARYMARRSAEADAAPATPAARRGGGPATRPSFGRRNK